MEQSRKTCSNTFTNLFCNTLYARISQKRAKHASFCEL